ncbi:MAG: tetratricopeptide repeat protein [Thermoanaerobaculia bacterium]
MTRQPVEGAAGLRLLISRAYQALEAGDPEAAERQFKELLASSPDDELALLGLAAVHESQGEHLDALSLARLAAQHTPQSAAAAAAVGRLLARLGAVSDALESLARARDLDPDAVDLYLLSALLLRDQGRSQEGIGVLEEARSRGLEALELEEELALLLVAERPLEARRLAQQALERHGERAGLHLALGLALATDPGSRGQAVHRLEQALELGVAEPGRVHLELGKLLLEAERPSEALAHLEEARELLADSAEVFYRLGAARRAAGDLAGAAEALARFQELNRQNDRRQRETLEVGTALNEAQELAKEHRLSEALERVERLLREHPEDARAQNLKAKILFSLERPEEALAAALRARELDPGRVEPHYLEGLFLMHLGRPADAEKALARAVALDPRLGEAHLLLGGAASKLGQPLEAVGHFERALELGVDSPALRLGYAGALESLGRLEESEQQLEAYRRLANHPE